MQAVQLVNQLIQRMIHNAAPDSTILHWYTAKDWTFGLSLRGQGFPKLGACESSLPLRLHRAAHISGCMK